MAAPRLRSVVLDTTDARASAEFWRELLGMEYRPGDDPPAPGEPDPKGQDWLVLRYPEGAVHDRGLRLAFQQVEQLPRSTWPGHEVPQQLHLDLTVSDMTELEHERDRVLALGATILLDRTDDPDEPLYVFADPSGHPFCVFVA